MFHTAIWQFLHIYVVFCIKKWHVDVLSWWIRCFFLRAGMMIGDRLPAASTCTWLPWIQSDWKLCCPFTLSVYSISMAPQSNHLSRSFNDLDPHSGWQFCHQWEPIILSRLLMGSPCFLCCVLFKGLVYTYR